jgi:RsiW-degrading membrane proteinase PrsW (M82 family)
MYVKRETERWRSINMGFATVLKLAVWGVFVVVALQVVFYFVFQMIGYNSYLLSITLMVSLIVGILLLIGWRILKRVVK